MEVDTERIVKPYQNDSKGEIIFQEIRSFGESERYQTREKVYAEKGAKMNRAGVLYLEKVLKNYPEPETVLEKCKIRIFQRLAKRLKQAPPADIEKTFEQFFKEYQIIFPADMLIDLRLKDIRKAAREIIIKAPVN